MYLYTNTHMHLNVRTYVYVYLYAILPTNLISDGLVKAFFYKHLKTSTESNQAASPTPCPHHQREERCLHCHRQLRVYGVSLVSGILSR